MRLRLSRNSEPGAGKEGSCGWSREWINVGELGNEWTELPSTRNKGVEQRGQLKPS